MKKLFNKILVLALLVLVPAFVVSAVSGTNDNSGSITIANAIEGKTYSAYQILKLESYNTDKGAYTYKIADKWNNFINSPAIKGVYVNVDDQGIVTWIDSKKTKSDMKTFAQLALAYAKDSANMISATQTETAATEEDDNKTTTVAFTGLNLGYYLVDSSVGALCSLTTTKATATAEEKNTEPTVKKEVLENSDNKYHEENTDYIGKTIYFKTTITASDGAENYVLYDKMSSGLTFNSNSIVVYTLDEKNEEVKVEDTSYTVSTDKAGYTFVITFDKSFTDELVAGDKIIVKYTAVLNKDAFVGSEGNPNTTYLTYGDSTDTTNKTPDSTTKTYTYSFDLIKTDSDNKLLTGAKFKLYDASGNIIHLVKVSDGLYRVATAEEYGAEGYEGVLIEAGKVTVKGLDNGDYKLKEVTAPNGYNKLASDVTFTISDGNLSTTMVGDTWVENNGGVHVINHTGAELPTTGGMGTILFITIGSLIVIGAGVLLVTKLRISKMNA